MEIRRNDGVFEKGAGGDEIGFRVQPKRIKQMRIGSSN
jgi:hypothetical protein